MLPSQFTPPALPHFEAVLRASALFSVALSQMYLARTELYLAQHWDLYKANTTRPLSVMVLDFPLEGVYVKLIWLNQYSAGQVRL